MQGRPLATLQITKTTRGKMITQIVKAIEDANKPQQETQPKPKNPKYITVDKLQPMPDFDPLEKLFEGNKRAMSKSKKAKIAGQIKSLAESYGYLAVRDITKTTIMPIPTNSKKLKSIFGNASQVSEALNLFQKAGLITIENSNYGFNHINPEDNKARTFAYNTVVESYLLDKFGDIEPYYCKPPKFEEIVDLVEYYEKYSPKIGRNAIPKKGSERRTNAAIKHLIEKRYPILKVIEADINNLNENFYKNKNEFIMRAEPSVTITDHTVSKVGYRPTSDFCCSTNDIEKPQSQQSQLNEGLIRSKILKKYGINPKNKYDVKASVPRVTRSIHTSKWNTIDDINDIYTEIQIECENEIKRRLDAINGISIQTPELANRKKILEKFSKSIHNDTRSAIKSFFMRGYFADSVDYMVSKIVRASKSNVDTDEIRICCDIFCDAMNSIIGESFNSEIFIYEGAIMTRVALKLCQRGNLCASVYDAFYTSQYVSDSEMEALFQESFNELYPYFKPNLIHTNFEYCPVCGCFDSKDITESGCSECKPIIASQSMQSAKVNAKNYFKKFNNIIKAERAHKDISLFMKLCDLDYGITFYPNLVQTQRFLTENQLKYPKLE